MSFDINDQKNIGGKPIQGGFPADLQFIRFNFANNQWEYVLQAAGETNLGANVGAGTGLVFRDKTGVTLNFKTLIAGTGITIVNGADDITISAAAGLGDLEFLRDKELSGDLILSQSLLVGSGVGASVTPASGKTFFFVKANLSFDDESGTTVVADVRNNAVIIDTMAYRFVVGAPVSSPSESHVGVGDSLVGDGVLVYDVNITNFGGAIGANTAMQGWIQNT